MPEFSPVINHNMPQAMDSRSMIAGAMMLQHALKSPGDYIAYEVVYQAADIPAVTVVAKHEDTDVAVCPDEVVRHAKSFHTGASEIGYVIGVDASHAVVLSRRQIQDRHQGLQEHL